MFTPQVMVIQMLKMAHFLYFCWCQQKFSHGLYKIFISIWKILYSSLRKCYGLLDSQLPLARYQPFKIHSFTIFCWLNSFQIFLPSIFHKWQLQNLWTIPFSERTKKDLLGALFNVLPKLWLMFCCHQQKIQKLCHFFSFLHFKTFKIKFHVF